jgi:hypothetical protein
MLYPQQPTVNDSRKNLRKRDESEVEGVGGGWGYSAAYGYCGGAYDRGEELGAGALGDVEGTG